VNSDKVDVALIGGGIMSATLATLLRELQPDWNIQVYERLGELAQESSPGTTPAPATPPCAS
jgi:malate dehydrogenase (quinone)